MRPKFEWLAAQRRGAVGFVNTLYGALSCGALALCLALAPVDARAQDNTVVSRRGDCPERIVKDLRKPILSLVPELQFYRQETGDELTTVSAKLREVLVGPYNVRPDDPPSASIKRYLVRVNRGGQLFCGWVDSASVLIGADPIRASEIDPTDQVETRRGHFIKNPLHLKVLLRSNPEVMPRNVTNWDPRSVPLFDAPNDLAPYKTINIFAVFRAYKVRKDPKTEKPLWYYIAGHDAYSIDHTAGWVKRESVFEWTNRVALYFSPDRSAADGVIYGTHSAAADRSQSVALARRSTTAVEPRERNIARFPILDRRSSAGNPTIYEIAMFGDATIGDAPTPSAPCRPGDASCVSSTQMVEAIGKAAELVKKSANMDILFVVDNTKSMRNYVKDTITGVKNAADRIRAEQKGQVRFAGALYGDYKSPQDLSPKNMQFKLNNFRLDRELTSIEAMMREPEYTEDGVGDLPEAGLAALVRAVKEANWSRDAGVKMVVWIGDHGSREIGDRETVGVEHVIAALKNAGITFFVPINVYGDYSSIHNKRFIEQAEAISNFARAEGGGKFKVMTTYDNASKSDTVKRVGDSIYLGYAAALGVGTELRDLGIGDAGGAPLSKPAPGAPTPRRLETNLPVAEMAEGNLVERILRMHGLSLDAINRYRRARQLMTYGYVNVAPDSARVQLLGHAREEGHAAAPDIHRQSMQATRQPGCGEVFQGAATGAHPSLRRRRLRCE